MGIEALLSGVTALFIVFGFLLLFLVRARRISDHVLSRFRALRDRGGRNRTTSSALMTRIALPASIITILLGTIFAYSGWRNSMDLVERQVITASRAQSHALIAAVQRETQRTNSEDKASFVQLIERRWNDLAPMRQDASLCVVSYEGVLLFDSANPGAIGTQVDHLPLGAVGSETPATFGEIIKTRWSWGGLHDNPFGTAQYSAYEHLPEFDAMLAVHIPAAAVHRDMLVAAIPWGLGAVLAFMVLPAAFFSLHRAHTGASGRIVRMLEEKHEQDATLRMILRGSAIGLWSHDLRTNDCFYSHEWAEQLGVDPATLTTSPEEFTGRLHPDDRVRLDQLTEELAGGNEEFAEAEFRLRHADGQYRWILSRAAIVRSADGRSIERLFGCHIDVTDRRHAREEIRKSNEQLRLLLSELDHRVRNNLAGLLGLVQMCRMQPMDVDSMRERIERHIKMCARVHALLSSRKWADLRLDSLLPQLFDGDSLNRVNLTGDSDITISADRANSVAVVLNELATNARKHGALSRDDGVLNIRWTTHEDAVRDGVYLRILWEESWDRHRTRADREHTASTGLGTSLVEGLVTSELRGRMAWQYLPNGVRHQVEILIRDRHPSIGDAEETACLVQTLPTPGTGQPITNAA